MDRLPQPGDGGHVLFLNGAQPRRCRSPLGGTRALLWVVLACLATPAAAERGTTRDALDRLEELLEMRQEDGLLDARRMLPTVLVSAAPRYEESKNSFTAQALTSLARVFGRGSIRMCEACMRPRTVVEDGRLRHTSGPASLDEVIALDTRFRGDGAQAKSGIWIDETQSGISVRVVDLRSGQVLFAQNIDPQLREYRGSARTFRLSEELERRTRGESLTHANFDMALYPGQHISLEWFEQWGQNNQNMSGLVLGLYDPVLGLGAAYYRALEYENIMIGAKGVLSIPTAIAQSQVADGEDAELLDPLFTGVFVLRYPFGGSNYGLLLSASTNGEVGIGISFLNTSFIPVLP